MHLFRKISLSSAPFYASLVVITSLAVFIGIFWAINEYQAYQESIENIKYNYRHQYEVRLQEEVANVKPTRPGMARAKPRYENR